MNYKIFNFFLINIIFLTSLNLYNVSMVYNFRIAQITKRFEFDKDENTNSTILALFFDQMRKKKHECIFQNFIGGFGSLIYDYKSYYIRMDSAFSHITEYTNDILSFSDTETDDILFSFGKNFIRNKKNIVTFSGLVGMPTHRIFRLQHTDFGYGQYSTGVQLDGSYYIDHKNTFLYGLRYIHFYPRTALDNNVKKYDFTIGNIADIFIANKNKWGKHGLEYGYTAKFRFDANCNPNFDEIAQKTNYIRSNFYIVYRYKFLIKNIVNKFLFNFSYGFDHKPIKFGNKYILTFWTSWNISF